MDLYSCEHCSAENLKESNVIKGLKYCDNCYTFYYYKDINDEPIDLELPLLLKELYNLSGNIDILETPRCIYIADDIIAVEPSQKVSFIKLIGDNDLYNQVKNNISGDFTTLKSTFKNSGTAEDLIKYVVDTYAYILGNNNAEVPKFGKEPETIITPIVKAEQPKAPETKTQKQVAAPLSEKDREEKRRKDIEKEEQYIKEKQEREAAKSKYNQTTASKISPDKKQTTDDDSFWTLSDESNEVDKAEEEKKRANREKEEKYAIEKQKQQQQKAKTPASVIQVPPPLPKTTQNQGGYAPPITTTPSSTVTTKAQPKKKYWPFILIAAMVIILAAIGFVMFYNKSSMPVVAELVAPSNLEPLIPGTYDVTREDDNNDIAPSMMPASIIAEITPSDSYEGQFDVLLIISDRSPKQETIVYSNGKLFSEFFGEGEIIWNNVSEEIELKFKDGNVIWNFVK